MPTTYEIDIALSSQTLDALRRGGYALYGFKAVACVVSGGAPLVWFATTSYASLTAVTWQADYQAYVSTSQIVPNGVILQAANCDIEFGQTAVLSPDGTLTPQSGGTPRAMSIWNRGNRQWTAGLSQLAVGEFSPICAVPLYGSMLDVIAPVERVLLIFAAFTVGQGAVVKKAFGEGLLVDLTGNPRRTVSYDIDRGWSQDGSWSAPAPKGADLAPLLITR